MKELLRFFTALRITGAVRVTEVVFLCRCSYGAGLFILKSSLGEDVLFGITGELFVCIEPRQLRIGELYNITVRCRNFYNSELDIVGFLKSGKLPV